MVTRLRGRAGGNAEARVMAESDIRKRLMKPIKLDHYITVSDWTR